MQGSLGSAFGGRESIDSPEGQRSPPMKGVDNLTRTTIHCLSSNDVREVRHVAGCGPYW